MDVASLLVELYGRVPALARRAVDGVDLDRLTERPAPGANTIAWMVWHLARVQDSHIAELLDGEQIWVGDDWAGRFGLDPDPSNTGYGHSVEEVETVRPESPEALLEYLTPSRTAAVRCSRTSLRLTWTALLTGAGIRP